MLDGAAVPKGRTVCVQEHAVKGVIFTWGLVTG